MTEQLFEILDDTDAWDKPSGDIVAENISDEQFQREYWGHAQRYEYVRGYVIQMPTPSLTHHNTITFLHHWFSAYFALHPIGQAFREMLEMRRQDLKIRRQPDIMILLHDNQENLTESGVEGAPDICIEVVSQGSRSTDYSDKLLEYEAAGVKEYWLVDNPRQKALFHRRDIDGKFYQFPLDASGIYTTPLLPDFALDVAILWQKNLPNVIEIVEMVKKMLDGE
jgi:Uma2 family endonuclease